MSAQARLKRLEELLLEQKLAGCLSVETLLDLLLCLHSEVSQSPLKREKHVQDFLDWGKKDPGLGARGWGPGARPGYINQSETVLVIIVERVLNQNPGCPT